MEELLGVVERHSLLCLDANNPSWENLRGYLFDRGALTLYFPVAKKYLVDRSLDSYEVLIWSRPRVLAAGRLEPAVSEADARIQMELARRTRLTAGKIDTMLFDRRNHQVRRTRYKLVLGSLREAGK